MYKSVGLNVPTRLMEICRITKVAVDYNESLFISTNHNESQVISRKRIVFRDMESVC
jgi:hypothetical protein